MYTVSTAILFLFRFVCFVLLFFFQDKSKLHSSKKNGSRLNLIVFSPRLVELFPSPKFANDLLLEFAKFQSSCFDLSAMPDESVPVVICAQSFHWFAGEKSVAEVCRVLKRGGKYGMIWNHRDWSVPWVRAIQDIVDPFVRQKDMPADPRELRWMESIDNSGKFTTVERNANFRIYLEGDIDKIVSVIMCISAITQSSEDKKAMVESNIRDILTNHPDLKGTQVYKLPYITDICWCTKK